jgi:hypothetical protein
MSGDSNYGNNGSVYWNVRHQNGGGARMEVRDGNFGWDRGGNAGNPAMTRKPWSAALQNGEWVDVSNVHPGRINGRDNQKADNFEVEMRFDTSPDGVQQGTAARRAAIAGILQKLIGDAQGALAAINGGAPSATLIVTVPAVNRQQPPEANWEVSVRWR